MPTSGTPTFDSFLEYAKREKMTLEDVNKEYTSLLEKIWSHETSLERLNRLQDEANEALQKYNNFLKEDNNKKIIKEYEKRLKKLEKIEEIEKKLRVLNSKGLLGTAQSNRLQQKLQTLQQDADNIQQSIENLGYTIDEAAQKYTKSNELRLECGKKLIEQQKEFNKRQEEGITFLDDWQEGFEKRTKALTKGAKEIGTGVKQVGESAWKMLEPWRKANHETMAYAKSVGMSKKAADAFLTTTTTWAKDNNIGLLYNKTTDELISMQSKYSEVLGRNVQLTDEQKTSMLAMEKFLGEDGTMDIANNLENFGLGLSDSAEFIKETIDDATKSGIHAAKLTKTVRENIKMAQNYTFKDGLKGLESMAKKAVALKTDMSLISGFANNVSTVEGAVQTGAKLQVLGGSYALGSDPLSMLYESLNDTEGLFDRAVGMAKGKVHFNQQSGNFEMAAQDRYMMKQASEAMGVDYNKMVDIAFRQASLGRIENQAMMNSNISGDKDMMDLVKNLATFENGRAVVDIDGKKVDVKDLTAEDKDKLQAMTRTEEGNLQDMAISLRSVNDKVEGIQKEALNKQAEIMNRNGQRLDNLLSNTKLMTKIATIMLAGKLVTAGFGMISGGFTALQGTLRMLMGGFNGVTNGTPAMKNLMRKGGGRATRLAKAWKHGGAKGVGKALSRIGPKAFLGSAGVGLGAGALSLGMDLINGDLQKDTGAAIGRAAGQTAGAAIGMFFGGPLGAMIGSAIAGFATDGIQQAQKKHRNKVRDEIADRLAAVSPQIASLFTGPDALQGNYKEKHLKALEKALEDGVLDSSEINNSIIKKARANGDLERIQKAGIQINGIEMARGGYLDGPTHAMGGMPILGSNITVEGGEYVINKEATKRNLPLLEKINTSNIKISPTEPLGKQMKVHNMTMDNTTMPHMAKFEMKPISLDISGTIKLDAGNTNIDITKQLLSDPMFIRNITNMISKQMNVYDNGSFNKGNFLQKFV